MILNNIKNQKERLMTCLWLGGEVNINDLKCVVTESYLLNLLYRLERSRLIKRKKYEGIKTVSLTDLGIEYVCQHYYLYANESPAGNLYEKSVGKDETNRKQKRAKSFIAFSNAGINVCTTANIPNISETVSEAIYIDSFNLKKKMGAEVQGSRVTGVYITKDETFKVFATDGMFQTLLPVEQRFEYRLQNKLMKNNLASKYMRDIIMCSFIEDMIPFLNYKRETGEGGGKIYNITSTDRNKYFVPTEHAKLQLGILGNMKRRNETINEILSNNLNCKVSNKVFEKYNDGLITSILDLNLGLIKDIRQRINEGEKITVICLEDYIPFFNKLFREQTDFITVTKDDILELIR